MYKKVVFLILTFILFLSFYKYETYAQNKNILKIYFFHSHRCGACRKVEKETFPKIKEQFKDKVEIVSFNTLDSKNYELMLKLCKKLGVKDKQLGLIPKLLIKDKVLINSGQINEEAINTIKETLLKGEFQKYGVNFDKDRSGILLEMFKRFDIWAVLGAGLLDGINPCAFATIIFFISFLGVAGYKRKELVCIGTIFIIAIFITYFLLGVGLFAFLFHFKIYEVFSNLLYVFIILFTLLIGILNLLDFYNLKKKGITAKDMKLQLPQNIKMMIHKVIGASYKKKEKFNDAETNSRNTSWIKLIFVTFIAGVVIAILESACTGQIYLPTLSFIATGTKFKMQAISFLISYNLSFISPLITIFLLALLGITSQELAQFSRRHLSIIKLSTGIFLLMLALGLYLYMFL